MIRNKWIAYFIYIILPFVHLLKNNGQKKSTECSIQKKFPKKSTEIVFTWVFILQVTLEGT